MKNLRVLLLVLLAVMLPIRGVMAAATLCPPHAGAQGDAHPMAMQGHGGHDTGADADEVGAGTLHDDCAGSSGQAHDAASGTDTCNLCSACCSVPPVPSAAPTLPLPHGTAATLFPAVSAPAPTFQCEGPERPPRSI